MSISRSRSLVCTLGQSEPLSLESTSKRSSEAQDRLECEPKQLSNEYWLPKTSECGSAAFLRNRLRWVKTDPRQLEIEEAERKAFVEQIRRTFARMGDAILWSVLTVAFATIALMPILGWFAALILATGLVSVFWIMWDRIRRI